MLYWILDAGIGPASRTGVPAMRIVLRDHDAVSGTVTIVTPWVNVENFPLFVALLTIHSIGGTGSPTATVTFQTSDDGITPDDLAATLAGTALDLFRQSYTAAADEYGRFIRAVIVITGTNPTFCYTLALNCFASS